MKKTLQVIRFWCAFFFVILFSSGCEVQDKSTKIKLYALDCGTLDVTDMDAFSDDGKSKGKQAHLVNPCFLIRHPKGDLLWDLGYQQELTEQKNGVVFFRHFHKKMQKKLSDQLGKIGLRPDDIELISVSHQHEDHIGNANLFSNAHWIVQETEHTQMFSEESKSEEAYFNLYAKLASAKTTLFKTHFDVFGDNSVVIKWMPGHTAGSTALLIRLDNVGTVLLTGDLYTHSDARTNNSVPLFNASKQATLDSRKQFEIWAKKEKAQVVIQHEKSHFDALPTFPNFLD
jgi:N-acyl homoserine lactone hydrolase